MAEKLLILTKLYENLRIIKAKPAGNKFLDTKMNLLIIKIANSKPANSKGRLYIKCKYLINFKKLLQFSFLIVPQIYSEFQGLRS